MADPIISAAAAAAAAAAASLSLKDWLLKE
jgi:hypothetical protein